MVAASSTTRKSRNKWKRRALTIANISQNDPSFHGFQLETTEQPSSVSVLCPLATLKRCLLRVLKGAVWLGSTILGALTFWIGYTAWEDAHCSTQLDFWQAEKEFRENCNQSGNSKDPGCPEAIAIKLSEPPQCIRSKKNADSNIFSAPNKPHQRRHSQPKALFSNAVLTREDTTGLKPSSEGWDTRSVAGKSFTTIVTSPSGTVSSFSFERFMSSLDTHGRLHGPVPTATSLTGTYFGRAGSYLLHDPVEDALGKTSTTKLETGHPGAGVHVQPQTDRSNSVESVRKLLDNLREEESSVRTTAASQLRSRSKAGLRNSIIGWTDGSMLTWHSHYSEDASLMARSSGPTNLTTYLRPDSDVSGIGVVPPFFLACCLFLVLIQLLNKPSITWKIFCRFIHDLDRRSPRLAGAIMTRIPISWRRDPEEREMLGIDDFEIGEFAYDYAELLQEVPAPEPLQNQLYGIGWPSSGNSSTKEKIL